MGELTAILAILCINVIYAYGVYLPAACGQLNLGAAGFITIGAYAGAWLNSAEGLGLPAIVSVPIAVLYTAMIGFVISFPILRTRGIYMVLATLAFAEVIAGVMINLEFVGGAAGMPVDAHADLMVLAPAAFGVAVFCYVLMATRFGLAMRSIHDDENVATLFGVNVLMTRVAAFTVGGAIMGLGGALYGHYFNYIEAQQFNVLLSIYILLYALLGGTQTALGPLVGALFFIAVPEMIRQIGKFVEMEWIEDGRFVAFGALIVLMMVFRPEGVVTRTLLERVFGSRRASSAAPSAETGRA
ncbi:MAG: branched-chain amino acid ABC transporter permease [Alphaproteobacteria bacterium]|nr:branched-chain amino acid ABC transporter permease [Planctomycetota bacterium]MCZ6860691.1 branched-chain amino acid ABC transporter permease [Alphaproteobacteria bacterium]